jgi:hypothetical protein
VAFDAGLGLFWSNWTGRDSILVATASTAPPLPNRESDLPSGALRHLLEVCLKEAASHRETRSALESLSRWLTAELARLPGGGERDRGLLTPAARGRDDAPSPGPTVEGALTRPLQLVLRRTRWKAAACKVSVDRQGLRHLEGGERSAAEAQLANRERVLRASLAELKDTSPWMLDQPFGLRSSQDGAFDVDDATAARLGLVADCYETLSMAVEKACELDESGAFRNGPPPAFLYLLAEAQSALLGSIAEAPVRSDSDQRDVFLWLKDQTTRFRIYVDRHMRLDDLADCTQSADLRARIAKLTEDLSAERKVRRQRGQLLNKIRYHARKLLDEGGATRSEADSLKVAVQRWTGAGLERSDRALVELLDGLKARASTFDPAVSEALAELLGEDGVKQGGEPAEARHPQALAEARELLGTLRVVLLAPAGHGLSAEELGAELGARTLELSAVDLDGPVAEREATLSALLEEGEPRLFLLGVRLEAEEYNTFKASCLERKFAFVRLPGQLTADAIAHQVMRQVGWRLRAQLDEAKG